MSKHGVTYGIYTAVLPAYREHCIRLVHDQLGGDIVLFAGAMHLDSSVMTDLPAALYVPVANYRLFGNRILVQWGHWLDALRVEALIVDLNPRSVTAWSLLLLRRAIGRRTIVWGHLLSRGGEGGRTAWLRRSMRHLARGTVVYSYREKGQAEGAYPGQPVWVAANALYPTAELGMTHGRARTEVLYVGRLSPAKKPRVLLEAFVASGLAGTGHVLRFVGDGEERAKLEVASREFGLCDSIAFDGTVQDISRLRSAYSSAMVSASPGYAGLSLTQSLGFGVPMIVSESEPHAPEIELADTVGGVTFVESDSVEAMAEALRVWSPIGEAAGDLLSGGVRRLYSAEVMAAGLVGALRDQGPRVEETKD